MNCNFSSVQKKNCNFSTIIIINIITTGEDLFCAFGQLSTNIADKKNQFCALNDANHVEANGVAPAWQKYVDTNQDN